MVWSSLCKLLQRQTYDVLSHRYGTFIVLGGLLLVIVSGFQFGEVVLEWSQEKYAAVFNSFSDNVAGKSFQSRLCLPVPIDIVYTWVNGSDPKLLQELRLVKAKIEMELNETRTLKSSRSHIECPFTHCVPSQAVIIEPMLPTALSLPTLTALYPSFKHVTRQTEIRAPGAGHDHNVTVLFFDTQQHAEEAKKESVLIEGQNASVALAFYTADCTLANSVSLRDAVIMTGFPHTLSSQQLLDHLPNRLPKTNIKVTVHTDKGVAVLEASDPGVLEAILKDTNFTIESKQPTKTAACLIWHLEDVRYNEEISASRFADNEELRYSLRSVETYAPWVRHVYLVTNGQIPSWLNLDNPRLTIVTHQEIFQNASHLPTFASPAIESHLHRIPGLSAKFIYMNDDVMFGKEVWPEDFYTHAQGQKVYLTWPIPNCQDGCPSSWIRDGYCDKACNNSECEWDGGDCAGGAPDTFQVGAAGARDWQVDTETMYCSQGCANNWVADRYCDQACNVKECGYDAGDCGVANFDKLLGIDLNPAKSVYVVPKGETVVYFNISAVFGEGVILEEGHYEDSSAIRAATLAQKYKTLTLLLFDKENATLLHFQIKAKAVNQSAVEFGFNVSVNPSAVRAGNSGIQHTDSNSPKGDEKVATNDTSDTKSETEEKYLFQELPTDIQSPRALVQRVDDIVKVNLALYDLDKETDAEWQQVLQDYKQGDLTERGFSLRQAALWKAVLTKNNGLPPPTKAGLDGGDVAGERQAPPGGHVAGEIQQPPGGPRDSLGQKGQSRDHTYSNLKFNPQGGNGAGQSKPDNSFDVYLQSKQQQEVGKGDEMMNRGHRPVSGGPEKVGGRAGWADVVYRDTKLREHAAQAQAEKGLANGPDTRDILDTGILQQDREAVRQKYGKQADQYEHQKHSEHDRQAGLLNMEGKFVNGTPSYVRASSYKTRKLNMILDPVVRQNSVGFLPWEKQHVFASLQKRKEAQEKARQSYEVESGPGRHLLDTYAESLRHVNHIYNEAYGYSGRKVPAHMPHLVDKYAMFDMQERFPKQWDQTSSHHIRSSTDMQFAFAYMYFIMSEPQTTTVGDIFDELDNDHTGVLSDREIRTMATRLFELPLDLQTLTGLEQMLINCSRHLPHIVTFTWGGRTEVYYDKDMPQVTKALLNNCPPVIDLIQKSFKGRTKYKFEVVDDAEVAFKMVHTNVSQVVGQLDDIRKTPKKFICLNDNIDHSKEEAKTVKAVLLDFYESILPVPSSFELPREYRNRFLHTDELRQWRKYRDWLKLWTQLALALLIIFTVGSFFADKIKAFKRLFFRTRTASPVGEDAGQGRRAASEDADPDGGDDRGSGVGGGPPGLLDV